MLERLQLRPETLQRHARDTPPATVTTVNQDPGLLRALQCFHRPGRAWHERSEEENKTREIVSCSPGTSNGIERTQRVGRYGRGVIEWPAHANPLLPRHVPMLPGGIIVSRTHGSHVAHQFREVPQ